MESTKSEVREIMLVELKRLAKLNETEKDRSIVCENISNMCSIALTIR